MTRATWRRFWVRADGDAAHFEPGQYMTIGVYADGMLYQRPYSVASAPGDTGEEGYEFYVRLVPVLRFTTLLWRLPVGHQMRMIGPKGRFMLEPDDERTHLFVSTGTGIAPFIAMSRHLLAAGHAAPDDHAARLQLPGRAGLPGTAGGLAAGRHLSHDLRAHHLASLRIPATPAGPATRAARRPSSRDVCRANHLKPEQTVVYLCGNPEMILNVESVLMDAGFPEFHVKKELYWPKGKKPTA